jgi:hypothetical protein
MQVEQVLRRRRGERDGDENKRREISVARLEWRHACRALLQAASSQTSGVLSGDSNASHHDLDRGMGCSCSGRSLRDRTICDAILQLERPGMAAGIHCRDSRFRRHLRGRHCGNELPEGSAVEESGIHQLAA